MVNDGLTVVNLAASINFILDEGNNGHIEVCSQTLYRSSNPPDPMGYIETAAFSAAHKIIHRKNYSRAREKERDGERRGGEEKEIEIRYERRSRKTC